MGDEEEVVDSAYTLHVASTYTWQRSLLVAKWREGKLGKRKKREGAKEDTIITHHHHAINTSTPRGSRLGMQATAHSRWSMR
jgi:hypothetical protein